MDRRRGSYRRVRPTAPQVRAALERCPRDGITTIDLAPSTPRPLDLTTVGLCDSSGLRVFLASRYAAPLHHAGHLLERVTECHARAAVMSAHVQAPCGASDIHVALRFCTVRILGSGSFGPSVTRREYYSGVETPETPAAGCC